MADKRIDIDIKTNADTEGAKEAADEIKKVGEQVSQTSEDLNEISDASGDAADSISKIGDSADNVKKTAQSLDELSDKLAEIKELNIEAGLLGGSGDYEGAEKLREEANALYKEYLELKDATDEAGDAIAKLDAKTSASAEGFVSLGEAQKEWIENQDAIKEASENVIEAIVADSEATEENTELKQDAAEALEEYVKQAEDAVEAFEDEAKAAKKMNAELSKIRAIQQAQLLGEFARGLGEIAKVAKDNGFPELAEGLREATTGLRTAATLIQGGLGISQLITQLGGLRAALAATLTFLTGPLGIALLAVAAAFAAFKIAVKNASDEMDRFAEEAAKPVAGFEDIAKASDEAFKRLNSNIDKEIKAIQKVIDKRDEELVKIRQKANLLTAQISKEEAIENIKVDVQESTGEISEEEAAVARRDIAIKYERERQEATERIRKETYDATLKAFEEQEAKVNALLAEREEIQRRINLGTYAKLPPETLAELKELNEEIQKLDKERRAIQDISPLSGLLGDYKEVKEIQAEINSLYEKSKTIIGSAVNTQKFEANAELEAADEKLKKAQAALEVEDKARIALTERLVNEKEIALINFEVFKAQEGASAAILVTNKTRQDAADKLLATEKEIAATQAAAEAARKEASAQADKARKADRDELIRRGEIAEEVSGDIPATQSLNKQIKTALLANKTGPAGQESTPAEAAELTRLIAELIARLKGSQNVQVAQGVDINKLRVLIKDLRSQNRNDRTQ